MSLLLFGVSVKVMIRVCCEEFSILYVQEGPLVPLKLYSRISSTMYVTACVQPVHGYFNMMSDLKGTLLAFNVKLPDIVLHIG